MVRAACLQRLGGWGGRAPGGGGENGAGGGKGEGEGGAGGVDARSLIESELNYNFRT